MTVQNDTGILAHIEAVQLTVKWDAKRAEAKKVTGEAFNAGQSGLIEVIERLVNEGQELLADAWDAVERIDAGHTVAMGENVPPSFIGAHSQDIRAMLRAWLNQDRGDAELRRDAKKWYRA